MSTFDRVERAMGAVRITVLTAWLRRQWKAAMRRRKRTLSPIWLAIPVVVLIGFAVAVAAAFVLWIGFGRPPLVNGWDANAQLETVRIALIVAGGIGGVVALVVAYRKQRLAELADRREDSRLFNERFMTVCAALGDDSAAVRLAGATALARLADDWEPQRQTCIDVLCAYIRLPYEPDREKGKEGGWREGEQEVRWSIIRSIGEHLRLAVGDPRSWQGRNFDFTGAVFDGGDFSNARFSGGRVTFASATFLGGHVSFYGAIFEGGEVSFYETKFKGGEVSFISAIFLAGNVRFDGMELAGGTVDLADTDHQGSRLTFRRQATPNGAQMIVTWVRGILVFDAATFQDPPDGLILPYWLDPAPNEVLETHRPERLGPHPV